MVRRNSVMDVAAKRREIVVPVKTKSAKHEKDGRRTGSAGKGNTSIGKDPRALKSGHSGTISLLCTIQKFVTEISIQLLVVECKCHNIPLNIPFTSSALPS